MDGDEFMETAPDIYKVKKILSYLHRFEYYFFAASNLLWLFVSFNNNIIYTSIKRDTQMNTEDWQKMPIIQFIVWLETVDEELWHRLVSI